MNNISIGTDTQPSAGGVFEASFSSIPLPNGSLTLKVAALFSDGRRIEKSTAVTVDNTGPPIAITNPTSGQVFVGSGIPIEVAVLDATHPPVVVRFFRETPSSGSLFLGEDLLTQGREYSDDTARLVDSEIARILHEQEARATELLTKYRPALELVAEALLEKETIDGAEVAALVQASLDDAPVTEDSTVTREMSITSDAAHVD